MKAIAAPTPCDVRGAAPSEFDATKPVKGLGVGYVPEWMQERPATDIDSAALEACGESGMVPNEG